MQQQQSTDRRRRHADNPTIALTLGLPKSVKQRLDTFCRVNGTPRNGVMTQAIVRFLDEREKGDA